MKCRTLLPSTDQITSSTSPHNYSSYIILYITEGVFLSGFYHVLLICIFVAERICFEPFYWFVFIGWTYDRHQTH